MMRRGLALVVWVGLLASAGADSFFPDATPPAGVALKQATVPSAGPGAGMCRQTTVPSDMVTSAGTPGIAGTCSRILQCGTSGTYIVTQFNVGGGC